MPEVDRDVLNLDEIDATHAAIVGGKAANLGELTQTAGIDVPPGFCVTATAFTRFMAGAGSLTHDLDSLARVRQDERDAIRSLSAKIRGTLESIQLPHELAEAITTQVGRLGRAGSYAIRSSATSEDLATASFAGQHDTYLNVAGDTEILRHITKCWASLFTERAVVERMRQRMDHRRVRMAVVVQRMVFPQAAGIAFTADPVTGNRRIVCVEAGVGIGEALVSGRVDPDVYRVRDGVVVHRAIAAKVLAGQRSDVGRSHHGPLATARAAAVLDDDQVVLLARLARLIDAHFGRPQDIEWCLVDGGFQIVQARPITTLFPVPERDDNENHVYVSVGHGQMMTDPMRPLGLSVWKLTAGPPMHVAGGRLFVDVTRRLGSPVPRAELLAVFGRGDPLIQAALQTIVDRGDFIPELPDEDSVRPQPGGLATAIAPDPAIIPELMARTQESIAATTRAIGTKTGPALLEFIREDLSELKRVLFEPLSHQAIMAGMEATWWLNDHMREWLGEPNAADVLTRSVPHDVTAQMGLALLDVADVIRPHADVVAWLDGVDNDDFLTDDALTALPGGPAVRDAIRGYLDAYGMRCIGEIDITRPRWAEQPTAVIPLILGNVRSFPPGEAQRRYEAGARDAQRKEAEVLGRLRALPDGQRKADDTKRMIDRVRAFTGYREYPKFGMISRYFVYKQALLAEAGRLVQSQVLGDRDDIFYLALEELDDVVRTGRVDVGLIQRRKDEFEYFHALTPPRVLTSEGEAITGSYASEGLPPGALPGLSVSTGMVEGRARVILDMAKADIQPGDILVTRHTDPSWSPLFVALTGLITEVGGSMTHGAVIAREYGLPALVGVHDATRLIRSGQRIRLNATDGYVQLLDDETADAAEADSHWTTADTPTTGQ